jgi:hypothetical protein
MVTVNYIFNKFKITKEEYAELDKEFGNLCYKAAWELKRKNFKNNYTDEIEDMVQDIKWHMSRAFIYTKRQMYIEASMTAVETHCKDPFVLTVMEELRSLWKDRTRHGANKQKFGEYQEKILDTLLNQYVPEDHKPNEQTKLSLDKKFSRYCKAIIWNCTKNLGKKITRERSIRSGLVSLSEFDFLAGKI